MKKIIFTESEMESIKIHGETCLSVAKAAMLRSLLNFDDIEEINNHYENHKWGSAADIKYRQSSVNKAIYKVASNPLKYIL
jgi:hypothetical protein